MKTILPFCLFSLIGVVASQSFFFGGIAKIQLDQLYGEQGIAICAPKAIEARNMPLNTADEIQAHDEFINGCEKYL